MIDTLRRLVAHMRWADERVLESLRAAAPSPSRALEIYAHVLGAEHVWLSRIRRRSASTAVWPELTLDECAELARKNVTEFEALLDELSPEELARPVPYHNSAGDAFESRIDDMLVHVAMHGSYHRGQVALLLRLGGAVPNATDYIAYVRGAPAATRRD